MMTAYKLIQIWKINLPQRYLHPQAYICWLKKCQEKIQLTLEKKALTNKLKTWKPDLSTKLRPMSKLMDSLNPKTIIQS